MAATPRSTRLDTSPIATNEDERDQGTEQLPVFAWEVEQHVARIHPRLVPRRATTH